MSIDQRDQYEAVWAELHANGSSIRYRRRGSGAPVILLPPAGASKAWSEVERTLAVNARVLIPDAAPWIGTQDGCWIVALLEGLGLRDALIVAAHGPQAESALAVAECAPEMVRRIAILEDPHAAGRAIHAWIETVWGSQTPLLLLSDRLALSQALTELERFASPGGRG